MQCLLSSNEERQLEGARANEFNRLCADFYEHVAGFSESMKSDRFCLIPRKGFVEDAEHVVVKRDRVYFASAKRLWHRIGQALARGHQPAEQAWSGWWGARTGPPFSQ
jgi:hypothetical protein